MPTKLEVNRGLAPTPLAHMAKLKPYIDFRLACFLADKAIISTPLAEVPPLAITDSTTILAKSFKENGRRSTAKQVSPAWRFMKPRTIHGN